jgi:Subtilase family
VGSLDRRRLQASRLLGLSVGVALLLAGAAPADAGAAPVRVGVIDSGVGAGDATGHGSAVATVLRGAVGDRARVRVLSFADVNRAGFAQPRLMAGAIRRVSAAGIRIANISQTTSGRAPRVRRALAAAPSTLFFVAAGNEGLDLDRLRLERDPCTAPGANVVCVAATGADGALAPFSNRGATTIDAAAPASATSFAAPLVAAQAARLLWAHPGWDTGRLREAVLAGRFGR